MPPLPCTPRRASALPCVPFGLCLTGRQERPPQARFHGAPSLHACPRRAPLPLHCPFGLCLAGRQMRPPQARFHGAPSPHACRAAHPFFPASPSDCALQGGRSGLRNPVSAARLFSHARAPPPLHACRAARPLSCVPFGLRLAGRQMRPSQARFRGAPPSPLHVRAAPDPAGGPPAPSALPHRFGNFYSKPHLREKAGCACIVYKSSRFGYSRLHENSERFFTNSKNLVSLYLGSRPALHGSAERPARRRTYRQRPTCRPHRERREKRAAFYCTAVFLCQRGNDAS